MARQNGADTLSGLGIPAAIARAGFGMRYAPRAAFLGVNEQEQHTVSVCILPNFGKGLLAAEIRLSQQALRRWAIQPHQIHG